MSSSHLLLYPVSSPYNVGQEGCLILGYEAKLAEAAIVKHYGSTTSAYNLRNTGQHQLPAQSYPSPFCSQSTQQPRNSFSLELFRVLCAIYHPNSNLRYFL